MSTNENKAKLDERVQRVMTAAVNKEPDRVPITPGMMPFAVYHYGYKMKDLLYDAQLGVDAACKFLDEFQPDQALTWYTNAGKGPVFELMKSKALAWPGAPKEFIQIPDDSTHQFIEFPVLLEEDMELFEKDYSGWLFQKGLPRVNELAEGFANFNTSALGIAYGDLSQLAAQVSRPEMRNIMETLYKIDDLNKGIQKTLAEGTVRMNNMGFPTFNLPMGGGVPFDQYSDFLRGTIDSMLDLYERRDFVERFCEERYERAIEGIRARAKTLTQEEKDTKWAQIILHKGMDGFLTYEQYDNLYWKHLRGTINEINKAGMKVYLYTEGPYTSRIRNLKEVDKNMVVFHFEQVDLALAKKELGDIGCIAGGFPTWLAEQGTKQQVIDEVKRVLDICAPGGGYIFEGGYSFSTCPPENIHAMFETVLEYGKY